MKSGGRGIGEVARLLGVKNHVIRYWEQEVPLIQPKKDLNGRHLYSDRDIQLFLRLKYFLYDRKYTVDGAKQELYRELSGDNQQSHALVAEMRSELLDLYFSLNHGGGNNAGDDE